MIDGPPPYRALALVGWGAIAVAIAIPILALVGLSAGLSGRWLWMSPILLVLGLGASLLARHNATIHEDRPARRIALSGALVALGCLVLIIIGGLVLLLALSALEA